MNSKICKLCDTNKNIEDFGRAKNMKSGYLNVCKICLNKRQIESKYKRLKRDKIVIPFHPIFESNGKLYRKCSKCLEVKETTQFNKTKFKKTGIYSSCKDCCHKHWDKNWNDPNKRKKKLKQNDRWMKKNRDKFKEYLKIYRKNRRKNDIQWVIRMALSRRIRYAVKKQKTEKTSKTKELLGCNLQFFRNYLESKFQEGMNWNNYGNKKNQWSLDHILCCELFDLTDSKQQFFCFNYKNIQPLWHKDNFKKNDFLDDGRRARDLSPQEKLEYLKSKGHDFTKN